MSGDKSSSSLETSMLIGEENLEEADILSALESKSSEELKQMLIQAVLILRRPDIPRPSVTLIPALAELLTLSQSKKGRFEFDAGKFTGNTANGIPHGKGKADYDNGNKYNGEWSLASFQGEGEYNYSTGEAYDGNFHSNLKHGLGTFTYADGSTLQASFREDKAEGPYKLTFPDGSFKFGTFESGKEKDNYVFVTEDKTTAILGMCKKGTEVGTRTVFAKDHEELHAQYKK
jgi:hypothetical protein